MAQYRYSASIIKRGSGRTVTAAAAYRAAQTLQDNQTGQVHDYTRKSGVIFAQIMAPENTPSWMLDRERLWNAVEAVERRKDSQLAREVQLSLPHELDAAARIELVQKFVQERFVERGLIADVCVHEPGPGTDDRNHHAHILLTTRVLTAEGFGSKIRSSMEDKRAEIKAEREAWADHQNRAFERAGLDVRVDHRSYMERGIDRAPTQHMGPNACEMEKKGNRSRIGNENRTTLADNSERAEAHRLDAEGQRTRKLLELPRVDMPPPADVFNLHAKKKPRTRQERIWAERDHERRVALESREREELIKLETRQQTDRLSLAESQATRNAILRATMQAEIDAIDRRMQAGGVTRFLRDLTGRSRDDRESRALHEKTLAGMDSRATEETTALAARQREETLRIVDRYRTMRVKLERSLATKHAGRKESLTMTDRDKDRPPVKDQFTRAKDPPREADPERKPPPPKPVPTMQPAPPRGAGYTKPRVDNQEMERRVQNWAATPSGKDVWQKGQEPPSKPRDAWYKSAPGDRDQQASKPRDDWYRGKDEKPAEKPRDNERDTRDRNSDRDRERD